ncbi:MAG: hypothetical protein IKA65_09775, partial [Lentisphaeria bacterium]|nr:hypothetical protein [Lentisphaeria bacterium]
NKSNSGESFWKMGRGEENLFSKRFLPHKTVLPPPFFYARLPADLVVSCKSLVGAQDHKSLRNWLI